MKKLVCAALAAASVFSVACAVDSTGKLSPQGARAYLDTIQALQDAYGKAAVAGADSPMEGMWQGLSLTRLVDFDADGIPELYCGMGMSGQRLYTYENGLKQLDIPTGVSNFGSDVSPETCLYVGADGAYLVEAMVEFFGNPVKYHTKQGDRMTVALTYTRDVDGEPAPVCTLNGAPISEDALRAALDELTAGMTRYSYSYWDGLDDLSSPKGTVAETIAALRGLTNPPARVSTHRVRINGKPVQLAAYEIGGNNYFKLRDLALALADTDARFEVSWNGAVQRIDLLSGKQYTPVGGEGAAQLTAGQAALTTASVWLDGRRLDLTAYQIAGNNYFKLRDLAAALDFGVSWDGAAQQVTIDTAAAYQD